MKLIFVSLLAALCSLGYFFATRRALRQNQERAHAAAAAQAVPAGRQGGGASAPAQAKN